MDIKTILARFLVILICGVLLAVVGALSILLGGKTESFIVETVFGVIGLPVFFLGLFFVIYAGSVAIEFVFALDEKMRNK